MIKVTVLYNLPPGTDEAEFVRWRTGPHHAANVAQPGVLRSDFYRVVGTPMLGPERPASDTAPYRFVTESYWPDLATFRAAWEDPVEQARLLPAITRIADALFLVSEELQTYVAAESAPDTQEFSAGAHPSDQVSGSLPVPSDSTATGRADRRSSQRSARSV